MAAHRRKKRSGRWIARLVSLLLACPALYLLAALTGSLVPVNRGWSEPRVGTTVYLADNGIHADLVMPVAAEGLDWSRVVPRSDVMAPAADARWIAFGSGERHVYLNTPTWWDITPATVWAALSGGRRVMHVEYVASPRYAVRTIRLRPDEYRRLWAAVRADFQLDSRGKVHKIDHPGYGPSDAFYSAQGRASLVRTCNTAVARWLRLAGVKASLWPPFVPGLIWRYRRMPQST